MVYYASVEFRKCNLSDSILELDRVFINMLDKMEEHDQMILEREIKNYV